MSIGIVIRGIWEVNEIKTRKSFSHLWGIFFHNCWNETVDLRVGAAITNLANFAMRLGNG